VFHQKENHEKKNRHPLHRCFYLDIQCGGVRRTRRVNEAEQDVKEAEQDVEEAKQEVKVKEAQQEEKEAEQKEKEEKKK